MKLLKLIATSAAALLAAGCVAYPYYDDPYYGDGYAYRSAPPVTYAPTVTYYYDYDYSPARRYYYRDGHRYYENRSRSEDRSRTSSRDDDRGRYWRDRDHRYNNGY